MPKDIGEVLPTPDQLEGERMEKETLLNKALLVKDFVLLDSTYPGQDKFSVIQAEVNGKLVTFSGGQVITKKLGNIGREVVQEGIRCKLVSTKSKKGNKSYFDLVTTK